MHNYENGLFNVLGFRNKMDDACLIIIPVNLSIIYSEGQEHNWARSVYVIKIARRNEICL